MTERAYTVKELDALRAACDQRWLWGTTKPAGPGNQMTRAYKEHERSVAVEELVRTHMLAGHTADDLYFADDPAHPMPVLVKRPFESFTG